MNFYHKQTKFNYMKCNIIQLMHSFEVNIRICQPRTVMFTEAKAEVNITFEG